MTGKNGSFTPPMYSHIYNLSTHAEENNKGKWHGWEMAVDKQVDDLNLYNSAKAFAESVDKGDVNVKTCSFEPTEVILGIVHDFGGG